MNEDPGHKNNPEEYGDVDDRVIGKAIRISLILLGVLVVGLLTIVYLLNRDEAELGEARTSVEVPVERVEDDEKTPVVTFVDISQGSGIYFTHNSGARGDKLLPESMGGGVMVMDFDGDGMEDLYFVNSTWWKDDMGEATDLKATTGSLYRNISKQGGEIQFEEWTDRAGLRDIVYGMGGAVGDIDNDGDPDIYVTCVGENRLYVNMGDGTFQESSGQWGVEGAEGDWSTAAAFFDYDRDGWLDLFVANYVQWSREIDFKVNFTIDGKHRAYGPPTDFEGAFPRLYRNMAGQGFIEVSETAGVQIQNRATGRPASKSLGLVVYDFNTDGWPDIMVANDTVANLLLLNQGDGTFKEVGAVTGVAYDANGNTRGAMGIDVAHFRNNDDVGVVIGNFANEMTSLYVSQGKGMIYADESIAQGIGPTSRISLKFGIFFWDYDLDGWQDILCVNGHLDEDIVKVQKSQSYRQSALLYWNNGGDGYVMVDAERSPGDLMKPIVGRGSAYGDFDGDGDLDVVMTQIGGRPLVLRNDQVTGNHWVRYRLEGKPDYNRDANGAMVELRSGGMSQRRFVSPTRSYLSQSEMAITFGLGASTQIDSLVIRWPDGLEQRIESPSEWLIVDREHHLMHPK